jgi:hypothetical protein
MDAHTVKIEFDEGLGWQFLCRYAQNAHARNATKTLYLKDVSEKECLPKN